MRTLVINLTRFGDLLQTQPTLSALRRDGDTVGLVCLDVFRSAAELLRDVDEVFCVPGARWLSDLDRDWKRALLNLESWSSGVTGRTWNRIVNLTPMLPARLLGRLLGQGEDGGFALDAYGFGHYSTPWAAFLQAASKYRGCSPFNLVDLFQRVAGVDPGPFALCPPTEEHLARIAELIPKEALGKTVAFQLGASQEFRRWPVSAFVHSGRVLWEETGFRPVLLGTAAEEPLGREFEALATYPFVNLLGRTTLPLLAAALARSAMLLTNDTGTMHLAAGLGVPVLAVFLATAQPFDTGPYLEGAITLEPDMECHPCTFGAQCPHGLACRGRIDPLGVGRMLADFVRGGRWTVPGDMGARVWRSVRDEHGFMNLEALAGDGTGARARWVRVQREAYRQFLDQRWTDVSDAAPRLDSALARDLLKDLERAELLVTLVAEQGRLLARGMKGPVSAKFLANCQALREFLGSSRLLGVLGPLWQYQSQDEGRSMEAFVRLCARYRELFLALRRSAEMA